MGIFGNLKASLSETLSSMKSDLSEISSSMKSDLSQMVSDTVKGRSRTTIGPITFFQIGDYYIAEHHITIGEWREFAEATKYLTDAEVGDDDPNREIKLERGVFIMELIGGKWQFASDHMSTANNDLSRGWGFGVKDMKPVKIPGASWKNPCFPGTVQLTDNHPAVLLSRRDADLFCEWLENKYGHAGGIERVSILDADIMEKLGLTGTLGHATIENTNFNDNKSGKYFGGTTAYNNFPADEKGFYDMAGNVAAWAYWQSGGERQYGTYGSAWMHDITTPDFINRGLKRVVKADCTTRTNYYGVRIMGHSNEDTLAIRAGWERWENNRKK